ncbi:MAG: TIGR03546 family protein [Endomicrobiaceae bacterium]|nr:TIGR03546 family protein [Endomicrobiaceae bacterium]
MFALKMLKKIIVMFQSDISPDQIAWGFALGAILGLVPNFLVKIILFIVIMLFKVNLTSALIACTLFSIVGFAIDPLLDKIGYICLVNINVLSPLYNWLYNLPIIPFTKFNNTVVMGSFILGLILIVPNGIFAKKALVFYRANYRDRVAQWKLIKLLNTALNATKIIKKIG